MPKSSFGSGIGFSKSSGNAVSADVPTANRRLLLRDFRASHQGDLETYWFEGRRSKRMIHGYASSPRHCRSSRKNADIISLSPKGCFAEFPLKIYSEHAPHKFGEEVPAIGEIVLLQKSSANVYVRGIIHERSAAADYAWQQILQGEVRMFSVLSHMRKLDGVVNDVHFVSSWQCKEISICREGANADCYFEIFNSDPDR